MNISKDTAWQSMLETTKYLSVVLLAFAFVKDLDVCADLPLSQTLNLLSQNDLVLQLNAWNGKSRIWIPEDCWFLVLGRLTVGHKTAIDTTSSCLVSDRGWSVFLNTFGNVDPIYTDPGHIAVKKGVPCRKGV